MKVSSILKKIQQCFEEIPENDSRAKVGPRAFAVSLVFSCLRDRGPRTLASLRRDSGTSSEVMLSRSSFWQRLASKKFMNLMSSIVQGLMKKLAHSLEFGEEILSVLGVKGILLLDSSSTTLPKSAKKDYPAPRNNVAPAAIKWHLLIDILSGSMKWFLLSEAKMHDRKGFPPLKELVGKLIIFDLGYYDFQLFKDISEKGGFFLSRVKENTNLLVEEVVRGLPKKNFEGHYLFSRMPAKKKKKTVEVIATLKKQSKSIIQVRVLGFWNPKDKVYHWYLTNLTAPAIIIYPLYRLRWQIELIFKSAKSSLRWSDMTSQNSNIIQSLTLMTLVGTLIAHPLARSVMRNEIGSKKLAISVQRSAMLLTHVGEYFVKYILLPSKVRFYNLKKRLSFLLEELYDPNYKRRETSLKRLARIAGGMN